MANERKAATKNKKKNIKLSVCLKAPFKLFARVRDLYVRSITNCSGHATYGSSIEIKGPSRSSSVTSSSASRLSTSKSYTSRDEDEDFRELMRAASTRSLRDRNLESRNDIHRKLPRSFTTGIETIDEEKPCEFGEDVRVNASSFYSRSRSHAIRMF